MQLVDKGNCFLIETSPVAITLGPAVFSPLLGVVSEDVMDPMPEPIPQPQMASDELASLRRDVSDLTLAVLTLHIEAARVKAEIEEMKRPRGWRAWWIRWTTWFTRVTKGDAS